MACLFTPRGRELPLARTEDVASIVVIVVVTVGSGASAVIAITVTTAVAFSPSIVVGVVIVALSPSPALTASSSSIAASVRVSPDRFGWHRLGNAAHARVRSIPLCPWQERCSTGAGADGSVPSSRARSRALRSARARQLLPPSPTT